MQAVNLFRIRRGDQGSQGILSASAFSCRILELPWRDNKQNISCIPAGEYFCTLRRSPRFGLTYHVTDVDGRSWILMHGGNYGGDKLKGYKTHTAGCLLLGKYFGTYQGQLAVFLSRVTLRRFMDHMGGADFNLIIQEDFGNG
nr:hypothetical protein 15 [bacterium]